MNVTEEMVLAVINCFNGAKNGTLKAGDIVHYHKLVRGICTPAPSNMAGLNYQNMLENIKGNGYLEYADPFFRLTDKGYELYAHATHH